MTIRNLHERTVIVAKKHLLVCSDVSFNIATGMLTIHGPEDRLTMLDKDEARKLIGILTEYVKRP